MSSLSRLPTSVLAAVYRAVDPSRRRPVVNRRAIISPLSSSASMSASVLDLVDVPADNWMTALEAPKREGVLAVFARVWQAELGLSGLPVSPGHFSS